MKCPSCKKQFLVKKVIPNVLIKCVNCSCSMKISRKGIPILVNETPTIQPLNQNPSSKQDFFNLPASFKHEEEKRITKEDCGNITTDYLTSTEKYLREVEKQFKQNKDPLFKTTVKEEKINIDTDILLQQRNNDIDKIKNAQRPAGNVLKFEETRQPPIKSVDVNNIYQQRINELNTYSNIQKKGTDRTRMGMNSLPIDNTLYRNYDMGYQSLQ